MKLKSETSTKKHKLLVIVGPTASGKSELALKLAKGFNGEVISCDSRQIYRGMDLGSGKVEGHWSFVKTHNFKTKHYKYKNIRHHLIDYISPKQQYSVALFKTKTKKAIEDILKRGKLPILCGGTGHWIDAVVFDQIIPDIKPNLKLRAVLEKKTTDKLLSQLKKLDPYRAKTIDHKNRRRLIRALEIVITTKQPVPRLEAIKSLPLPYDTLWIGIQTLRPVLYKKIDRRLKRRIKAGMLEEVKILHDKGLSWKQLELFGLEYKYVSLFLQKKLPYEEMLNQLSFAIRHYTKRQLTWWAKNKNIHWTQTPKEAEKLIKNYL